MYEATFYKWCRHYGKEYNHNGAIPRDHWIEDWERDAIIRFHFENPLDGYRRLAFMMLDHDIVAVSPATVFGVLSKEGLLNRHTPRTQTKGSGFDQPAGPHRHWHVDVAHLNICGTFYFMATVIDGYSRYVVHWEIREGMKEIDIEAILQRAKEIHEARDRKLAEARDRRRAARQNARATAIASFNDSAQSEDKALPGGNLSAELGPKSGGMADAH